jgi:hypothetical protein
MSTSEIPDPLFREAVRAIDSGDVGALEALLGKHDRLVRERVDHGEGYFRRPYLLWFVAENPIRNGKLPGNIAHVAQAIVRTAERHAPPDSLREQLDYALGLVCSGCVARECGVQGELIDVLGDAGANPDAAMVPALAHRELAAVDRLLRRGATTTLLVAACAGRLDELDRLLQSATAGDRQAALAGAAFHGQARILSALIGTVDLNAYSPPGFHPHATALHHAVDSGSLDAVEVLVDAGAAVTRKDNIHQGTPLDWAVHLRRQEIADYLRGKRSHE